MIIADFEMSPSFVPGVYHEAAPGWWYVFCGDQLLVETTPAGTRPLCGPPPQDRGLAVAIHLFLGYLEDVPCFAAQCPEPPPLEGGLSLEIMYRLWHLLPKDHVLLAGRALELLHWMRIHRFCGRCGTPLEDQTHERARRCPSCNSLHFPRIAPAIMAMVRRGPQVLLARSSRFPTGFFSVLAGFVECGETLEVCLRREVREEVGLEVGHMRYFGSQSWPFPNSLMIGFVCEYTGGELKPDGEEIIAADWFWPHQLPMVPGKESLAGQMIAWYAAGADESLLAAPAP